MTPPCPAPEDLVTLLDKGAGDGGPLQQHVAGCPRCQEELRDLRAPFDLLRDAECPADQLALRRIAKELSTLRALPPPPRAAPAPSGRRLWLSAVATCTVGVLVSLAFAKLSAHPLRLHPAALILGLAGLLALPALRLSARRGLAAGLLLVASAAALVLGARLPAEPWSLAGRGCLMLGLAGAAPALLLLSPLWRRLARAPQRGGGVLLGISACSAGSLVQVLVCTLDDLPHALAMHLTPFLLGVGLCGGLLLGLQRAAAAKGLPPGGIWE